MHGSLAHIFDANSSDAVEIRQFFWGCEDQISYIGLLTSASNARNLAAAEALLAEAKADGLGKAAIYAPVISCAAKSGNVAIAEQLGSLVVWWVSNLNP